MKHTLIALFLLFIITGAMLSVAQVYVPAIVDAARARGKQGGLYLNVQELSEKPQSYFTLENPDSYFLQAISNLEEPVFVGTKSDTQIDDEISAHGGNMAANVEFNNHYYYVYLVYSTIIYHPAEEVLIPILMSGWIIWGTSTIVTICYVAIRSIKKRSKKTAEQA